VKSQNYTVTMTVTLFVEACISERDAIFTAGEAILRGNRAILGNAEICYAKSRAQEGTHYTIGLKTGASK
jgi:hypothetical protein